MASSYSPHFFKIVLSHTLKQEKLEIPKKFVREHGKTLLLWNQNTNNVYLKVAGADEKWKVGLMRSSDKNGRSIWFQKGWKEFVEFYSVRLGYFLVFKYEGDSCFYVVIFDQSASEIKYPIKKKIQLNEAEEQEEESDDDDDDDDDDVQIMDYGDIFSSPCKKKKINTAAQSCFFPDSNNKITTEVEDDSSGDLETVKLAEQETPRQKESVLERAMAFQSMTQNPSFLIKMSPSHISPAHHMNIPRSFTDDELDDIMEAKDIILKVSDGKTWSVRCGVYWSRNKHKKLEFRAGWRLFVNNNDLKTHDVCVFEFVKTIILLFKVTVFRSSSSSSSSQLLSLSFDAPPIRFVYERRRRKNHEKEKKSREASRESDN